MLVRQWSYLVLCHTKTHRVLSPNNSVECSYMALQAALALAVNMLHNLFILHLLKCDNKSAEPCLKAPGSLPKCLSIQKPSNRSKICYPFEGWSHDHVLVVLHKTSRELVNFASYFILEFLEISTYRDASIIICHFPIHPPGILIFNFSCTSGAVRANQQHVLASVKFIVPWESPLKAVGLRWYRIWLTGAYVYNINFCLY